MKLVFYLTALCCCSAAISIVEKNRKLTILHISDFPDYNPRIECRMASRLVVELVNSRRDILPDYQLEVQFKEEALGTLAPRRLVEYMRQFEGSQSNDNNSTQSPIVVGPFYSTGCKPTGPILNPANLVGISTHCTSPALSDRRPRPNLYLSYATDSATTFTLLHFIRSIGKWSKIGILGNILSIFDVTMGLYFQKMAIESNFTVAWIDMVTEVNEEALQQFKEKDVRIIVMFGGYYVDTFALLCLSHKIGMRGQRYAYFLNSETYQSPEEIDYALHPSCTKELLKEQMQYALFAGISLSGTEHNYKSFLGHTGAEFGRLLKERFGAANFPEHYYTCHDAMLKAIVSLDVTEKKLQTQNLTLANYSAIPSLIMKIANQSVLETKPPGIRIGPLAYTLGGQVEGDIKVVASWNATTGKLQDLVTTKQKPASEDFVFESYEVVPIKSSFYDASIALLPQTDGRQLVDRIRRVDMAVFIAASVTSGVLAVFQGLSAVLTLLKASEFRTIAAAYLGYLAIDAGCLMLTMPQDVSATVWNVRVALIIIGLSISNGFVCAQLLALKTCFKGIVPQASVYEMKVPSSTGRPKQSARSTSRLAPSRQSHITSQQRPTWTPSKDQLKRAERLAIVIASIFVALNAVILAIWLGRSNGYLKCSLELNDVAEDVARDTLTNTWIHTCQSETTIPWLICFVFLHIVFLLLGGLAAYQIGKSGLTLQNLAPMRICLLNSVCLIFGGLLMVVVFSGRPLEQQEVVAFLGLTISGINSLMTAYSTVRLGQISSPITL